MKALEIIRYVLAQSGGASWPVYGRVTDVIPAFCKGMHPCSDCVCDWQRGLWRSGLWMRVLAESFMSETVCGRQDYYGQGVKDLWKVYL